MMESESNRETGIQRIAAVIGEPARSRMLYSLMDGRARTSTELSVIARVKPSTASVHLNRLKAENLVKVDAQGKHRYYSLRDAEVAGALEGLGVLAGTRDTFIPNTPAHLRLARTCYDHLAGSLGVSLHDCFWRKSWLATTSGGYDLTPAGLDGLESLGVNVSQARLLRRRFGFACIDWSERRPHLGGALGSTLLQCLLKKRWLVQDTEGRAVSISIAGRRELQARFDLQL
jgi:DNA-binding transcriptional ArsR family regulator